MKGFCIHENNDNYRREKTSVYPGYPGYPGLRPRAVLTIGKIPLFLRKKGRKTDNFFLEKTDQKQTNF